MSAMSSSVMSNLALRNTIIGMVKTYINGENVAMMVGLAARMVLVVLGCAGRGASPLPGCGREGVGPASARGVGALVLWSGCGPCGWDVVSVLFGSDMHARCAFWNLFPPPEPLACMSKQTRNIVYHKDQPSQVACWWFIPCIYRDKDGNVMRWVV